MSRAKWKVLKSQSALLGQAETYGYRGALEDARDRARLTALMRRVSDRQLLRATRLDALSAFQTYKKGRMNAVDDFRNKMQNLTGAYRLQNANRTTKFRNAIRTRTEDRLMNRQAKLLDLQKLRQDALVQQLRDRAGTLGLLPMYGKRGSKLFPRLRKIWRRKAFQLK